MVLPVPDHPLVQLAPELHLVLPVLLPRWRQQVQEVLEVRVLLFPRLPP